MDEKFIVLAFFTFIFAPNVVLSSSSKIKGIGSRWDRMKILI